MIREIKGPREERTENDAREGKLLTAANARFILAEMETQVKSAKRRKQQAAFFATNIAGKLSEDAVEIYKAYANGAVLR